MKNSQNKFFAIFTLFAFVFSIFQTPVSFANTGTLDPVMDGTAPTSDPFATTNSNTSTSGAETGFEAGALSAPTVDPLATIVSGLQNLLPKYIVGVRTNEQTGKQELLVSYVSATAQANGTLTLLTVEIEEQNGKMLLNMDTLKLEFKGITLQNPSVGTKDMDILEDGIGSLLETGFIGSPAIDEAAKNSDASYSTGNPVSNLYKVLSLSQVQLTSVTTSGTGVNQTRNVVFAANGLTHTASRKTNGTGSTYLTSADPAVRAAMNYIVALQTSLGNGFRAMLSSRNGTSSFNVVVTPRQSVTQTNQISKIEFTLNASGVITANSQKIFTGAALSSLSLETTSMLWKSELQITGDQTGKASLANLMSSTIETLGTAPASLIYKHADNETYRLRNQGTTLIVENITHDAELQAFINGLRQTLGTNNTVQLVSIDLLGRYKVTVSSTSSPVQANDFQTMTFDLQSDNNGVVTIIDGLPTSLTFKGVIYSAADAGDAVKALFKAFSQILSAGTSSDFLVALTKVKILTPFNATSKQINFTYKVTDRDYRSTLANNLVTVQDRTDYRLLQPHLNALSSKFPAPAQIVETRIDGSNPAAYKISITMSPTLTAPLMSLEFDVALNALQNTPANPAISNLKAIYKVGSTNLALTDVETEILKSGIANISGKSNLLDVFTALKETKLLSKTTNNIFTVEFASNKYEINEPTMVAYLQSLRASLGSNFTVQSKLITPAVGTSPSVHEVKIVSTVSPVPTNTLAGMTFRIQRGGAELSKFSDTLSVDYAGFTEVAGTSNALYSAFGSAVMQPGPIASFESRIKALSELKINQSLWNINTYSWNNPTGKMTFTYGDRDYRIATTGTLPVEDRTDFRLIGPYLISNLGAKFPATVATFQVIKNTSPSSYNISITFVTATAGQLKKLEFDITPSDLPAMTNLKATYKTAASDLILDSNATNLLKDGIKLKMTADKNNTTEVLAALRATTVEKFENNVFTVVFATKRYDIKIENDAVAVLSVYPVVALAVKTAADLNAATASLDATLKAQVAAWITRINTLGGSILMSIDREGSVSFSVFLKGDGNSGADGTLTTVTVRNNPRTDIKTIETSSTQPLTTLSRLQFELYLKNYASAVAPTTVLSASYALNYVAGGPAIISGTTTTGSNNFHVMVYANRTVRTFLASTVPTVLPNLTPGISQANAVLTQLEGYMGRMSVDAARQVESLRAAVTSGNAKFVNVEKVGSEMKLTWFTSRDGSAMQMTLTSAVVAVNKTVINPIHSAQLPFGTATGSTVPASSSARTLSFIEMYLKNHTTKSAVQITEDINKLRGSASGNGLWSITTRVESNQIIFTRNSAPQPVNLSLTLPFNSSSY